MNNLPLFTCVIVTYKKFEFLECSLISVIKQTYPNIEIIVSDDGSENFPYFVIEKLEKEYGKKIKLNISKVNRGTVKNINSNKKLILGKYVFFMGGDDELYDIHTIEKIVNSMERENSMSMAFSRVKYTFDGKTPIKAMPSEQLKKKVLKLDSALKQYKSFCKGFFYDSFSGSCIVHNADFWKEYSYDEDYILVEDAPFLIKSTKNGLKIDMDYENIIIKYRDGGISSKLNKNSQLSSQQTKDIVMLFEKEVINDMSKFNSFEKRYIIATQEKRKKKLSGSSIIPVLLKYPDSIIFSVIKKIYLKVYRADN